MENRGKRTFPTCDARRLSSLALASSRDSLHFPEETTLLSVTVVRLPTTVGRTRASMRSLPRSLSQSVTASQSVLFIVLSPSRARQSSGTRFPSKPKERTHGRGRRATETRAEEVAAAVALSSARAAGGLRTSAVSERLPTPRRRRRRRRTAAAASARAAAP